MLGPIRKPTSAAGAEAWVRRKFGLANLRPGQAEVVAHLLAGKRVLFVAPTGHGKSLCYQALAASPWSKGVVLVFQPLKALMQEQVLRARDAGLHAELVNSDQETDEQQAVLDSAAGGELDILFLAPERQGNRLWLDSVGSMEIKGIVIDEAHCISQWGHDFRPWYRRLVETVIGVGIRTPVLAVTATAPPAVVADVIAQIGSDEGTVTVERLDSYRSNLELSCFAVEGFSMRLAALLHITRSARDEPGIAYLLTQDEAEMAAGFLAEHDVAARPYHAGLETEERAEILRQWRSREISVLCATSALGMGLDRADVRWIAHAGMPDSLLRYVQEIGRAGRDGKPARAMAVHDPETKSIYRAFLHSNSPPPHDFRAVAQAVRAGARKRTEIVLQTDIPEDTVQRILDEQVRRELCTRGGSPFAYTWIGGEDADVPEGLEDAIAIRKSFLKDALAYVTTETCRAVALARAMGDVKLPDPCGRCDQCRRAGPPDLAGIAVHARNYLAAFCPEIRKTKHYEAGLALSRYGLGRVGEAIKRAKYAGDPVPRDLVDIAVRKLRVTKGPYSAARFGAVVSIPSTTSRIVAEFANSLAARLGVPWIELVKKRETEPQKQFRSRLRKERNIRGALALPVDKCPDCVLLVDDVLDSGASLREAATLLHPSAVYPLVLARAKHQDDV